MSDTPASKNAHYCVLYRLRIYVLATTQSIAGFSQAMLWREFEKALTTDSATNAKFWADRPQVQCRLVRSEKECRTSRQ